MNVSKKSLANLRPPKKGEPSRNPKGRPKKEFAIPEILRRESLKPSRYHPDDLITRLENICIVALEKAEGRDPIARAWISDRMEGKAVERIISREGDMDLIIE